jgi:Carbohydrate binding module (family 6)
MQAKPLLSLLSAFALACSTEPLAPARDLTSDSSKLDDGNATPSSQPQSPQPQSPQPQSPQSSSATYRDAFASIAAVSFDEQVGTRSEDGHIGYTNTGDYLRYDLDFGLGAKALVLRLAAPSSGGKVQVRIDSASDAGGLLATHTVSGTGSWSAYADQVLSFDAAASAKLKGKHALYLVFVGDDMVDVASLQFSKASAVAPSDPHPAEPAGAVNSLQNIIDDMTMQSTGNGRAQNEAAVHFSGSYLQAKALLPGLAEGVNNITSWCWAFRSPGDPSSNTEVQVRHQEAYALLASTGNWVRVNGGRPSGFQGTVAAADLGSYLKTEKAIDADTIQVNPGRIAGRSDLVSYEMWTPDAGSSLINFRDVVAVYATCQMRLAKGDPNGVDDRAEARFAGQVGFDLWNRNGGGFFPGTTFADGSGGRMERIGAEWQAHNALSIQPLHRQGLAPYVGRGDWTPNVFDAPPYVLERNDPAIAKLAPFLK